MNQSRKALEPAATAAAPPGGEPWPDVMALEAMAPASRDEFELHAPANTIERHYALGLALRALKPGGSLSVSAARNRGGLRLRRELEAFGCTVEETSGGHARICRTLRPDKLTGIDAAIAAGAMRHDDALGLWTQPGLFAWDRIDAGTQALMAHLPELTGQGADFGCGLGILARAVLQGRRVRGLCLIDNDARAIEAARRNVEDPRAIFRHGDVTSLRFDPPLDFVVANPPFHAGGEERRGLGIGFVAAAARALRKGGAFWCVANRHLPYEAALQAHFASHRQVTVEGGFKIMAAVR
ncbi:MAG: methyltransferase [Hyphomicrobiales bacterium]|nr:methyltransferase [Hyphomicrobiales bacterium]